MLSKQLPQIYTQAMKLSNTNPSSRRQITALIDSFLMNWDYANEKIIEQRLVIADIVLLLDKFNKIFNLK